MRRSTALLCAAALLAACGNDVDIQPIGPDDDAPPAEPAPATPPADDDADGDGDAEGDPFAVPDDIDEAYVQAVLDELVAARNRMLELTLDANPDRELPIEVLRLLDATHGLAARAEFGEELQEIVAGSNIDDVFFTGDDFGGERFELFDLVAADVGCLVLIGTFDRSENVREPRSERRSILSLGPVEEPDPDRNPTPWQFLQINSILDGDDEPMTDEDIVEVTPEEWLGLLDTTCERGGA